MSMIYTVNASSLRLRDAPVDGNVITNMPMDMEVEVLSYTYEPGWWHVSVQVGNMIETGYVAKKYLLPYEPEPAKKFRIPLLSNITSTIENVQKFAGNYAENLTPDLLLELNDVLAQYKINKTPLRFVHFVAQITHETGHFRWLSENLNYSDQGLLNTFSKYFPTEALAREYARQPERIANRVYANRMENGDEASGDGWRYRGRGYIQLTGRENYRKIGDRIGVDLENNPDIVSEDPTIALRVSADYWDSRKINKAADKDDLKRVTRLINGGYNGLADRERLLKKAKYIWGG
jgi:putative chitinase